MTTGPASPAQARKEPRSHAVNAPGSEKTYRNCTPSVGDCVVNGVLVAAPAQRVGHDGSCLSPGVPAWGFDGDGSLLGCLLRNAPGAQRGAMSTDADVHTAHYALRIPAGLADPATGQVFREARNYAMPAVAAAGSASSPAASDTPQSLARVDDPGVIRAAKPSDTHPGTLVLRLYQPTNARHRLNVTLGQGRPERVHVVTALEDPIPEAEEMIALTETGFTIDMPAALATVQITPSHRRT
jgi:hypothetical protein